MHKVITGVRDSIVAAIARSPKSRRRAPICAASSLLLSAALASAQVVPLAEIVQTVTLTTINGNAGHIAANNLGDAFYVSQTDNVAYWLPRGRTTPIPLVTGLSGGRSVYVDAKNNVFVSSNYSGRVIEVPYVNGTYATNTANSGSIASCSASPTGPCLAFGNGAGATGYYLQAGDIGFDQLNVGGNGPDAYVVDERDNVCNQANAATSCNTLLKFTPTGGGSYTASVIVTNLPQTNNGQIAVGPNGDVYYADGTYVYYIAAGQTTYTKIGANLVSPTGVSTDVYGNLYITDSGSGANKIYEMPQVNGVAQPASQFIFLNNYSANGIAFDGLGHVFYTGYSSQTNLNQATISAFNLGSSAIGKPVSVTAATLTVQFTGAVTLGTINAAGTSSGFSYVPGTCAAGTAYIATSSCSINATYTPTAVGLQTGSISLTNAAGATIAVAELSGVGLGAAETNDPGTLNAIGANFTSPQGIAVDSSKNVYIADPGQNAVLLYPAGSSTGTKVGTGLLKPTSVALDNSGNLYIADSGNGRVVEVPNVAGMLTSSAQTVIATTYPSRTSGTSVLVNKPLGSALGIAIDLNNNLYIADANNSALLRVGTIAGIPNAAATTQIGFNSAGVSSFIAPIAVATDSVGNVFVADMTSTTSAITEITYYGSQLVTIGTGFSHPTGIATDAAGSLYVADMGNGRLLKIPYEAPIYNTNDQYTVGSSIVAPYGVALDSAANLYVVDSADAQAFQLNRAQGTLALGRANINTSTSQSNVYVGDAGNQPLMLGNPDYVATGNTSVFTITSPSGNGCTNSSVIAVGTACVLNATFSPTVIGNYSELLSFTSNAANTSTPNVTVTGVGLNQAPSTVSLAQTSPSGTASFGQSVVITATIASTKPGTPSGTVTFFVDGAQQAHPSTVTNGLATITLTGLTGGKHTIGGSYSGDNNFAPSSASTISITVAQASSTISLAETGGYQTPPSATPGTALTLLATVTPGAATVPTGSVTFSVGSTIIGTSTIQPKIQGTSTIYQATLALSTLPSGADAVVATYSGDLNYSGSTTTLVITIIPPSFTMTPSTATITVPAGQTGTANVVVTSLSGFTGYVGLNCSGLPANATCGFSPNGFALAASNAISGATNVLISIYTETTPIVPQPPVGAAALRLPGTGTRVPVSLAIIGLAPLALLLRPRRSLRTRRGLRLLGALFLLCGGLTLFNGCGSGFISVSPKGSYQVTVTATATSTGTSTALAPGCAFIPSSSTSPTCTQTTQVTLVVQ